MFNTFIQWYTFSTFYAVSLQWKIQLNTLEIVHQVISKLTYPGCEQTLFSSTFFLSVFGASSLKNWWTFNEVPIVRGFSHRCCSNFLRISRIFSENDEMSRDFDKNCQKRAEKGRKFWNLCQISFVHFIFSILSLLHTSMYDIDTSPDCRRQKI